MLLYFKQISGFWVKSFDRKKKKFLFPIFTMPLLWMFHSSPKITWTVALLLTGSACSNSGVGCSKWLSLHLHVPCVKWMYCP